MTLEPWMLVPTGGVPTIVMVLVWYRLGAVEKKVDAINGTVQQHSVEMGRHGVKIEQLEERL